MAKTGIERIWLVLSSFWVVVITLGNSWMAERNLSWRSQMLGGGVGLAREGREEESIVGYWMMIMAMVEEPGTEEQRTKALDALW